MAQRKTETRITRRHFLYALGSLAGVAIGGWILNSAGGRGALSAVARKNTDRGLRLRSGLVLAPSKTGAQIYDESAGMREGPVCAVNHLGLRVIKHMDGEKTVEDIARDLLVHLDAPRSDTESFKSSVAMFMAELASAGLLSQPFFVDIHAREIST